MTVTVSGEDPDVLLRWRDVDKPSDRRRGRRVVDPVGALRFAFYGRLSTKEHQHSDTSRRWQLECAQDVIAGFGAVVAEFFDVGFSRRRPWPNRPQAAALLAAVTGGGCPFDAIVVGEYERAFCGRQVFPIAALLRQQDVQLWLPETLGPVNLDDPAHQAVLIEVGARSLREVQRARHRATEAMRVQARDQGRYLGGRPPYGYRLVDAGPHPTPSHARWGRQQQQLDPDPATAEHVRWIFARRLQGRSMSGIARELNERSVPCPSEYDRNRNRHRHATGWSVTTIKAILANPRYTGRQVWNRQAVHHHPDDGSAVNGAGRSDRLRNARQDWVISAEPAHPALITEADFVTVQTIDALPRPADGTPRHYRLVGVLRCAFCRRRMISHWTHQQAWYRCRHGHTSATPIVPGQHRTLYVREDRVLGAVTAAIQTYPPADHVTADGARAYLRAHDMVAVCDGHTITLQSNLTAAAHHDPGRKPSYGDP